MYLNYVNVAFKNLGPSSINKSVKEIRKSNLYKARTKIKDEQRNLLDDSLKKLKDDNGLELYDYKILIHNLDVLQNESYDELFISMFIDSLDNIDEIKQFIKPLLSYIYNNLSLEQSNKIYPLLREISLKTKAKGEYKTIIRTIKRYDDLESFFKFIENKIIKAKGKDIMLELKNTYCIKSTDEFYIKCMCSYILKNMYIEEDMDSHINIIKGMSYEMRIDLLKEVLGKCKGRYKDLKIKWIKEMGVLLNHPYNGSNSNWNEFDKAYKDEYILFYNNEVLDEAFKDGQEDKKEFFISYIKDIYNITYFENFRKALVMEFKNHTLISIGNALYIYNSHIYNIHKLKEILEVNKKSECYAMLRDEEVLEATLNYKKQWQSVFKEELLIRGYKGEG